MAGPVSASGQAGNPAAPPHNAGRRRGHHWREQALPGRRHRRPKAFPGRSQAARTSGPGPAEGHRRIWREGDAESGDLPGDVLRRRPIRRPRVQPFPITHTRSPHLVVLASAGGTEHRRPRQGPGGHRTQSHQVHQEITFSKEVDSHSNRRCRLAAVAVATES
jgi:hypothetical protein